jgi:hypothetical protein
MPIRRECAESKNDSSVVNVKRQGGAPKAAEKGFFMTFICSIGASGSLYNHGEFFHKKI